MRGRSFEGSVVPPLLTLALGLAVVGVSFTMRAGMLASDPGPALLPRIAGIGLVGISLCLLWHREPHEGLPRGQELLRVLVTIVLVGLYIELMEPIGFPAATALFLACQMLLVGLRSPVALATMPLVLSGAIYILFRFGLEVPLPATRIGGLLL